MRRSAMRSVAALVFLLVACANARYHGREIGALSQLHHGVKGTVYAVDARTLFIQDFHYDGVGPAAYFYVGSAGKPTATGAIRLRDERGGTNPLRKYRGEGVTVSLPDGITLKDVKWFSVWCDDYAVNFGDVTIPRELEYPKPAKVGALRGVHGVSSDQVVVVDAQTLLIPNFSYDGEAPDAKFWVGRGETPSPQGIRIPDENGKEAPLRKYDKKTIVLTLPGELTVFDIGHFAVWCEAFTVNFGHVVLPRSALANVPPSLKMLGVSPQSRNTALAATARAPTRAHRPKIAKVDATTYRPALALAAGPHASPDHRPATHEHLHRRAYSHSSNDQLVQVQPSQELHFKEYQQDQHQQSQDELYRQYQDQKQRLEELQRQYQQTQLEQKQLNEQKQDLYNQQNDQKQQQRQSQLQYQQDDEQQNQKQQYQQDPQNQRQEYHQYQNQQQYSPEDQRVLYERQLYERQLYEQQRLAYERELLQQRRAQDEEPFRYRLLPYSYDGGR